MPEKSLTDPLFYECYLLYSKTSLITYEERRMWYGDRRRFLERSSALACGGLLGTSLLAQTPGGQRPEQSAEVEILFPRDRIPMTFIIDDSTCLVNMGHFCIPQFHACYPDREVYQKPWHTFPREIPDSFVREFGEWCANQGVKGKYSIVPYPACVGWMDRELPGWSRKSLQSSLQLVRELMVPNWDIHPEMITHTRVIDLKTGRPMEAINPSTMENSYPQEKKSVDELAAYLAYALQILKNCGLPCEGVTTPGGFGNMVKSELSLAAQQAVRDVFQAEIPHFFKYVVGNEASTEPTIEHVSGLGTSALNLTVNIPAGTGDWFGGWEGDVIPEPDRYATADGEAGRLIELIDSGQPAFFLCHWAGLYSNGTKAGFHAFQRVVNTVHAKYPDRLVWMKLSEIARYWAAKELTTISRLGNTIQFDAPFRCPQFTLRIPLQSVILPSLLSKGERIQFVEVGQHSQIETGKFHFDGKSLTLCFTLPQGVSTLQLGSCT